MTHVELVASAREAIDRVHSDRSVAMIVTYSSLEELLDQIEMMLEALGSCIEDQHREKKE